MFRPEGNLEMALASLIAATAPSSRMATQPYLACPAGLRSWISIGTKKTASSKKNNKQPAKTSHIIQF